MIADYEIEVIKKLGPQAIADAMEHAIAEFPKESCGFICSDAGYVPCQNVHETPETHFRIEDPEYDRALKADAVLAVVHSHPNGPMFPSHADMMGQLASDVPWVIITVNEAGAHKVIAWGGDLPIAPVIGRPFLHGVLDCMSLIRDVFRLGREELLKQGVHWPLDPIPFDDCARQDDWWKHGDDLYSANLAKWGFKEISRSEAQPGDVFLCKLGGGDRNPKDQLNHGGLLLEHGQILQHLPNRLSQRTPASIWARAADLWVRYEGKPK